MAYLVLEDGTMYEGAGFGAATDVVSDVVVTTGMTGGRTPSPSGRRLAASSAGRSVKIPATGTARDRSTSI